MSLTLIRNAAVVAVMDDVGTEIASGAIAMKGGVILAVGTTAELAPLAGHADVIIEAAGCVITPGLVNTHHHLYQTLTRALPGATEASLFGWLKRLYPVWATYTPDDVFAATQLGLAELALSGCSLSSDHLYLFPNGVTLDDTIHAAEGIGLRFHATRGAMSVGESAGGLPPDSLVEREDAILADCIRVIDRFHDASDGAMVRVGVAPCSPFSVSRELMRDAALLAREKGVMLHTHLAEDADDVAFSLARFGVPSGAICGRPGLDRAGCVARALRAIGPCRDRLVCPHEDRRGALSGFELQARFGHRAAAADGGCRGASGAGRGWVRFERYREPAGRGAAGDAAPARDARGDGVCGARGAAAGHARRG